MQNDPLAGKYLLKCSHPGCNGQAIVAMHYSAGWAVGQVVPMDSGNPAMGRCPQCRRYKMKVASVPPVAAPPGPKGFTKVPTS